MILADNETCVDLLNNESIAKTIIEMLRARPDHPITVGVHGDWGAGKSSILEMIEACFESDEKVLCLKFNGWRFQGFEDAKIALIEGIVTGLIKKRPATTGYVELLKNVFQRIDWLKVAKKTGGLAFTAFTGIPTSDQIQTLTECLQNLCTDPAKFATPENINKLLEDAQKNLKPPEQSTNVPQEIEAFRKAFNELLEKSGVEQLVVLIDDLDRCLPDTAIETLEAVRLFVFTSRTAFIIAADESMIEYAVRKHFPDLPDTTGPQTYARNYLEKLIQVPFRIPSLGDTETRIYVTLLLVGAELGDNDPSFLSLIAASRERLRRPWTSGALDAAIIKQTLGEKASRAMDALMLSDQLGPILASGTKGNPRQIKRFLNTLVLREQTAKARGFEDDIKSPILAKLMLAERFLPRLFDQIAISAAASHDGCCHELMVLEIAGQKSDKQISETKNQNADSNFSSKQEVVQSTEGTFLGEWLSSSPIKAWAEVQPSIGNIDLRPYLFITKDRKDYFGTTSILGHLASVAERLFGPELTVRAMESDLKRLAPLEAAQVFEAVRGRIVGGDSFETEPSGVAGLTVLVRAHPPLQSNLLDFLEGLPQNQLGPWVCSGWDSVIKDAAFSQRLTRLLESWSNSGNKMLKTAATGVLRTRKGGR